MAQTHNSIAILGMPIDNLNMDETVEHIFAMIDGYQKDQRPRQVATVNVDFVVNTLSWSLKHIRHPELLDILRRADLVTPDGMPIVWVSRFLGVPLKERVAGADLVPRLAQESADRQKSIYFLGGRSDVGRQAADLLKKRYPDLKIAGTDAPFVHTEGIALSGAEEEDQIIVERINRSGADILLIGFGNPKQEIWLDRNRNRLKVPVSIGIGGTYEFIVGSVARAPVWMQKTGLEWVYRITQDPWRLWKRYFVGFFKFGLMVLPAILYYRYRRFLFNRLHKRILTPDIKPSSLNIIETLPIKVVTLSDPLDAAAAKLVKEELKDIAKESINVVLDLSRITFIDSSGIGLLVSLRRGLQNEDKDLFLIGIGASVKRLFTLSRVIDLFEDKICDNIDEVLAKTVNMEALSPFYYIEQVRHDSILFNLFGTLDAAQIATLDIESVKKIIEDKDSIFNLRGLNFVDSSGIMFFLKIQKHLSKYGKTCVLCGLQNNVKQMFHITKLKHLFKITDDTLSAEKTLERIRKR